MSKALGVGIAVISLLIVVGCGESATGGGATEELDVTWLYTGPEDDGGYNTSQIESMNAMAEVDGVTVNGIYNIPYNQRASQIIKQAIAGGSNVIVDTIGLAGLLTDPCEQSPQVYCYASADTAPQPENSRSFWIEDWNLNYLAGMAAGRMTKTNTIGFIGAFDVPLIIQAANSYALGCQRVNPDCKVRAVFANTYFDPPKTNQQIETLVDSGADVLRNWIDDPGFCQIAQKRGIYAVGEFLDFHETCPDSIITSTVWDFDEYFQEQARTIQAGDFEGSGDKTDFATLSDGEGAPHLGEWGDFVPEDVRTEVEEVAQQIIDGEDVIVGPISDQDGTVVINKGEVPGREWLMTKWDWFVEGVVAG